MWGISLKPQPPHMYKAQQHEQKCGRKTAEFALFLSIWIIHVLSILLPCMWGAGATRAFLEYYTGVSRPLARKSSRSLTKVFPSLPDRSVSRKCRKSPPKTSKKSLTCFHINFGKGFPSRTLCGGPSETAPLQTPCCAPGGQQRGQKGKNGKSIFIQ